ncbi:MAG: hypothetical protein KDK08_22530, partial [Rhizobiaceae bacterium]|nr:hypothetical protein [Rhizobiaceae bacterium]
MTIERAMYIVVPNEMAVEFAMLQERGDAALRRAAKLPAGDTKEVARFEALSAQIEKKALAYAAANPERASFSEWMPSVARSLLTREILATPDHGLPEDISDKLANGESIVVAARPHIPGATKFHSDEVGPRPPAEPWIAIRHDKRGAESERFEAIIENAIAGKGTKVAINPLAVSNRVLTETLRRHVHAAPSVSRIDIPVEYRDGSTADPFPLRAASLSNGPLPDWPILRFTLLSIRHVEMDHVVDGAWFRNSRISLPRPAGLTDAEAFAISTKQITKIRALGPRIIEMYQTGFQPAVTGFYRAVTNALVEHP